MGVLLTHFLNGIMKFADKWTDVWGENIIQGEVIPTQEENVVCIHFRGGVICSVNDNHAAAHRTTDISYTVRC